MFKNQRHGGDFVFDLQFHAMIDRTGAEALIPQEASREIIQELPQSSAVMRLGRRLPNMTTKQRRLPILASMVHAYFVAGDTGQKQTSSQAWENKFIDAEELAVIIPIPEAVLDDSDYDIWGEVKPRIVEAFGLAFDQAVLYGTNAPASWPSDILTAATAAGHVVAEGTGDDLYDDIFSVDGTIAKVEEDGYLNTGHVSALTLRAKLRGLRDANGRPLFNSSMQEKTRYELDGVDTVFPLNGAVDPTQSLLISGDWSKLVWAVRQDVTYKILDQAVIQDTDGEILYNLAQQDMVALRAVMRLGWQLPNPASRVADRASRYPFAVLTPGGGGGEEEEEGD